LKNNDCEDLEGEIPEDADDRADIIKISRQKSIIPESSSGSPKLEPPKPP